MVLAIIMDGNGRWAKAKGKPRTFGHHAGAQNVRTIALHAQQRGVKKLILYAFSTENWRRPEDEVGYLMQLPSFFFNRYMKELLENNIRVSFIGELDRFPAKTREVIEKAVEQSKDCHGLELCLAVNYGSKREIALAAQSYARDVLAGRDNDLEDLSAYLMSPEPVDLMIRTSGEKRISNFLLLQLAYSELIFTEAAWPDFGPEQLDECLAEFARRNRRFGGLT